MKAQIQSIEGCPPLNSWPNVRRGIVDRPTSNNRRDRGPARATAVADVPTVDIDGLMWSETPAALAGPMSTVMSRWHRARREVRDRVTHPGRLERKSR